MNTVTISESRYAAREKYLEYKAAVALGRATDSDALLMETYRAIARGKTVLDLHQTMRQAGVDLRGRPRLAIARADKRRVAFGYDFSDGRPCFWDANGSSPGYSKLARKGMNSFHLPHGTFQRVQNMPGQNRAIVPTIPPDLRPGPTMLKRYAILWEAEWESAPADPILLAPIRGRFFAVVAQWDLTALERAVLLP